MRASWLIFNFIILSGVYCQEWAPVGAEWYYDVRYAFYPALDYHRVYCDTIMEKKGRLCKRINIDDFACNVHFWGKQFTCVDSDTVFFYNPDVDSFEILYCFNAKPGDFWFIHLKTMIDNKIDTVKVFVDSVSSVEINGRWLRKLFVSYYCSPAYHIEPLVIFTF